MRATKSESQNRPINKALLQVPILREIQKRMRWDSNEGLGSAKLVRVYAGCQGNRAYY